MASRAGSAVLPREIIRRQRERIQKAADFHFARLNELERKIKALRISCPHPRKEVTSKEVWFCPDCGDGSRGGKSSEQQQQ